LPFIQQRTTTLSSARLG
jgi:hypothetical protein